MDGKDLRGSTLTDVCVPTVSLKAMQSKHRSQTKPKVIRFIKFKSIVLFR